MKKEFRTKAKKIINSAIEGESEILQILVKSIFEHHFAEKEAVEEYLKSVTFPEGSFEEIVKIKHQITTTPHGTEFLSSNNIVKFNRIKRALEANDEEGFKTSLKEFVEELKKFPGKKTANQEAQDVLRGTEHILDKMREYVELIFEKTNTEVTPETLEQVSGILSVGTWGMGNDNDGKPGSVDDFQEGIRRNAESILRRYILELAVIRRESESDAEKVVEIDIILKKLIATTIKTYSETTTKTGNIKEKVKSHLELHALDLDIDIKEILPLFDEVAEIIDPKNKKLFYEKPEDLSRDLYALADGNLSIEGKKYSPNKLAISIAGVQNYGFFAQKGEYRQNANVFRYVVQEVQKLEKNLKNGEKLEDAITAKLEALKDGYYETLEKIKEGAEISKEESNGFYFYDTIGRLQIMAKDPDAFKGILIAECGSRSEPNIIGKHVREDFLYTKYLADLFGVETPISPIVEYKAQITELPAFVGDLFDEEESRKYFEKHGLTLMIAGSDSFKSSSSSVTVEIQRSITYVQELCEKNGIKLTLYYGAGSSLHRNANGIIPQGIVEFIVTKQGLAMREETLLAETFKSVRQTRSESRNGPLTPKEAINDIGNNYNQLPLSSLQSFLNDERFNFYSKKYTSEPFAVFVDNCLPNAIEKFCSTANRPASRPPTPGATGSEKPSTPQEEMRAIGYGQILNDSGWGAFHLYSDLSNIMGTLTDGYAQKTALKIRKDRYLLDPYFRDTLNRAMENLALSDPDQGWDYVKHAAGFDFAIERNFENFATITIGDKPPFSINDILDEKRDNRALYQVIKSELGGDKDKANKVLACIISASFVELEHQKALRATNQLLRSLNGDSVTGKSITPSDLIASIGEIDKQRAESLTKRLKLVNEARGIVFKAPEDPRKLKDKASKLELYQAKAVLREIFEKVDHRLLVPQISPSPEVGSSTKQLALF